MLGKQSKSSGHVYNNTPICSGPKTNPLARRAAGEMLYSCPETPKPADQGGLDANPWVTDRMFVTLSS
jgi:hypothetical protein